jgi:hypothetical protein
LLRERRKSTKKDRSQLEIPANDPENRENRNTNGKQNHFTERIVGGGLDVFRSFHRQCADDVNRSISNTPLVLDGHVRFAGRVSKLEL